MAYNYLFVNSSTKPTAGRVTLAARVDRQRPGAEIVYDPFPATA